MSWRSSRTPASPVSPALFVKDESEREEPARPAAFEPMGLTGRRPQAPAAGPATPAEAPAAPAPSPAIPAETPLGLRAVPATPDLSDADDRVYDLAEFDAVALDGEPEAAPEDEERVYDLSEFGAVALA